VLFLSRACFGGQLDDGQPETVDPLHDFKEPDEAHRLGVVTVRIESITLQDIRVRRRGSQDNYRNTFQRRALLDFLQDLPAVFLRQVQIERD
jgi:hypothetical protein